MVMPMAMIVVLLVLVMMMVVVVMLVVMPEMVFDLREKTGKREKFIF